MRQACDSTRASFSCQSIAESIQMSGVNKFAYINPVLQTDEKVVSGYGDATKFFQVFSQLLTLFQLSIYKSIFNVTTVQQPF